MNTHKPVRKAVIAAAGFGTRFLPQTKAMPKEMLPLVDKPIIQYIVEELVEAGIKDIIIVSNYNKRAIEDHFDQPNQDLVNNLIAGGLGKAESLKEVENIAGLANFAFVRQKGPYGSATPLVNAAHLIGDEPFIYAFADDLIEAKPNRFKQMIDLHNRLQGSILPCIELTKDAEFERYGIVDGEFIEDGIIKMSQIIEKPGRANAPSDLASVGGYLLTPDVFEYLDKAQSEYDGSKEFYLTTYVIEPMIEAGLAFYGCRLDDAKYHDTGNKLEYLKTVVDFALKRDDIKDEFCEYIKKRVE